MCLLLSAITLQRRRLATNIGFVFEIAGPFWDIGVRFGNVNGDGEDGDVEACWWVAAGDDGVVL